MRSPRRNCLFGDVDCSCRSSLRHTEALPLLGSGVTRCGGVLLQWFLGLQLSALHQWYVAKQRPLLTSAMSCMAVLDGSRLVVLESRPVKAMFCERDSCSLLYNFRSFKRTALVCPAHPTRSLSHWLPQSLAHWCIPAPTNPCTYAPMINEPMHPHLPTPTHAPAHFHSSRLL